MRLFINFTQHDLTEEQVAAAREMGTSEIINAKDVLPNFQNIANDDGNVDPTYQANQIAKAIVALAGKEDAIVHFPVSSPRVQAAFWRQYEYWKHPTYADAQTEDYKVWKKVHRYRFVFSHTARVVQDMPQPDGSVKKTTVFKFEKFVPMIYVQYYFEPRIAEKIIENAYALGIDFVYLSGGGKTRFAHKKAYQLKFKCDMQRQRFNHLVKLFLRGELK